MEMNTPYMTNMAKDKKTRHDKSRWRVGLLKLAVLFFATSLTQACASDDMDMSSGSADNLQMSLNTLKASLNIIQIDGVHQDYIHQMIYFRTMLEDMNDALSSGENTQLVTQIAGNLNDLNNTQSLGTLWGEATYMLQSTYYVLPTTESPGILGRKAVGTAIYMQYVAELLQTTQTNLMNAKAEDIGAFISINTSQFSNLINLTTAYYAQANTLSRTGMNAGFDYERTFLVHFTEPLNEFYK